MATLDERIAALQDALQPPPADGSQDLDARMASFELAAAGMLKSPEPRTFDDRMADLEAYVLVSAAPAVAY